MNTFSQFSEQSAKHWSAMTVSTRVMAFLLIAVVSACVVWSLSNTVPEEKAFILGEMSGEDIRSAQGAFAKAGLNNYEIVDGSRITVPSSKRADYLNALSTNNAMPVGWGEKFKDNHQPGLFETSADRAARRQSLRERAFEEILRRRPHIEAAFVEYDEVRSGFGRECLRTCCIHLQPENNRPIPDEVLSSIRDSATKYFAGLQKDNVSAIDISTSYGTPAHDGSQSQEMSPWLTLTKQWEDYYHQKIQSLLTAYGEIEISVDVDFDPQDVQRIQSRAAERSDSETEIVSTTRKRIEIRPSEDAAPFTDGETVTLNNQSLNQPKSVVTRSEETEETKLTRSAGDNAFDGMAAVRPSNIRISVGIPESYYVRVQQVKLGTTSGETEKLSLEQSAAWTKPSEEQLADIRTQVDHSVRAAIATIPSHSNTGGQDEAPNINVYSYVDLPPANEILEWNLAEWAATWITDSWATLSLLGLTAICLLSMLAWVKGGSSTAPIPADSVQGTAKAGAALSWDEELTPETELREDAENIQQDLSQLIQEHPEAAKRLLKNWLGDAA